MSAVFHTITAADWRIAIQRARSERSCLAVRCPDCGAAVPTVQLRACVEGFAECPRCGVGSELRKWGQNPDWVLDVKEGV